MARLLTHLRRSLSASSPPCLTQTRRLRSTFSGKTPQIIEIDISSSSSSSSSSSDEVPLLKTLDEIAQNMMVKKATPDWLPFVPGASFWVPPRPRRRDGAGGLNLADVLANLADNLPDDDGANDQRRRTRSFVLSGSESEQERSIEESAEREMEIEDEASSDSNDIIHSSENSEG